MSTQAEEVAQYVANAYDSFEQNEPTGIGWNELRDRLVVWFQALDDSPAFYGMLWLLEHRNRYPHQLLAGELLWKRNLPMPISLRDFLQRTAESVNASASSVGRYVKQQHGREAILCELQSLRAGESDPRILAGFDSFEYWLGSMPNRDP